MNAAGTRVPRGVWFEPTQPVARLVTPAGLAEDLGAEICVVADEAAERDVYVAFTAIRAHAGELVAAPDEPPLRSALPRTGNPSVALTESVAGSRISCHVYHIAQTTPTGPDGYLGGPPVVRVVR